MRAAFLTLLIILLSPIPMIPSQTPYSPMFDGENAFSYLTAQCEFGPRPPGSENISLVRGYISDILSAQGWVVFLQNFTYQEVECANIVAVWPERNTSTLILGAHYDTRPRADQESDPTNRMMPVLGANDAASGVAVLLELARILPEESRPFIEIVLFDAEDSGNINGWNWIVGSTYYVDQMSSSKREDVTGMILLDMVGDINLRIPREGYSTRSLQDAIWIIASELGHDDIFLDTPGASILDDHRPFLLAGIPAVDLIHTPFPWTWHTLSDTPEQCSSDSLQAVGRVVEAFIVETTGVETTFTTEPPPDYIPIILIVVPILLLVLVVFLKRK